MPGERKRQAQDGNLAAHQPSVENAVSDSDDGITQFEGERPRVGKRMAAKHEASRTESEATKRHRTGGRQHDRSRGAKRSSTWSTEQQRTHLKTTHCSMVAATETHQYGGSDTEESERGTFVGEDNATKWWSTNSHASPADDRTDAEWWQGVEGLIVASMAEPTAEIESADTHRELSGYALTGAEDQGIWSESEVEQRTELFGD